VNGVNQCHPDEYSLACGYLDTPASGLSCRTLTFPSSPAYCCPCR
jgi:hypothetical protein